MLIIYKLIFLKRSIGMLYCKPMIFYFFEMHMVWSHVMDFMQSIKGLLIFLMIK